MSAASTPVKPPHQKVTFADSADSFQRRRSEAYECELCGTSAQDYELLQIHMLTECPCMFDADVSL